MTVHPSSLVRRLWKFTADKMCLLQCTVYITLRWKTIHCINLKLTKWTDACACIYRERMRWMCLTCWLRSGFSHLIYIDSLSLTWYLVGAESKILKQSKLQEVHDKTLKPVNAYKRETICPMTCAHARAWKSVWLFRQRNKHYSLHRKICRRCVYEACQGGDLSR